MTYDRHDEVSVNVAAEPEALFDHLDDQERLAAHMNKPSMMMMGGRMFYKFDAARGRAVGSVIRMGGSFLWLRLFVEEVVTQHERPHRKAWKTLGVPHLILIDNYRMGFEIEDGGTLSRLRVLIDYDLPRNPIACLACCSRQSTHAGASSAWPRMRSARFLLLGGVGPLAGPRDAALTLHGAPGLV